MKKARKAVYYGSLAVIVVTACILIRYYYVRAHENDVYEALEQAVSVTAAPSAAPQATQPAATEPPAPTPTPEPRYCPVDFTALHEASDDIYAWIEIPGLDIAYPVLQNPTDDNLYLRHDVEGKYNNHGAIYSMASVNKTDCSNYHLILYGHNFKDGTMFSNLTQYRDRSVLEESGDIYIYTPDRELRYKAFAAVTFSNGYIPYYYEESKPENREAFLNDLPNVVRDVNNNILEDVAVTKDDHLLILSTCTGNTDRVIHRYLVVAVLQEETPWTVGTGE